MKKSLVQETKVRDKACVRRKKICQCGLKMPQKFHLSNEHETFNFDHTFRQKLDTRVHSFASFRPTQRLQKSDLIR